ncbi:uncharacterized protein LOC129301919 isoform X2 [Prosopis cineraria]|uniref:uncharacterized protein LOC129301919 isoform X2 n=1 Tax=Prosopis cineraria TaxID=364024 RepID=UPI00241076E5|nr:uncharacterized protein LOC129301919 isoform X2 [Prosopis cineraria]
MLHCCLAQSLVPMLKKGANYDFWSLKMKTMFKSRELWDMVEKGFIDNQTEEPDQPLRENRKKDAKALFLIQQALHDEIFPLIASATTSTQAWEILKQEYSRNKKETSITMHSNSEAPKNKNKEVWRESATRRDAKKEKEEDFENAILVVVTLIITLTYQALLDSTTLQQGTEIQWDAFFPENKV